MTVREAVMGLLRAYGITTVFGNPGSTELKMFKDWPRDFHYVLGLNESCCVAMADAFAQVNRNASFVNLHSAAGVGHAMASIFNAYRNQSPVIVLAGQQTRAMFPTEPFLFATDAAELPKPYVKWSVEPARARRPARPGAGLPHRDATSTGTGFSFGSRGRLGCGMRAAGDSDGG